MVSWHTLNKFSRILWSAQLSRTCPCLPLWGHLLPLFLTLLQPHCLSFCVLTRWNLFLPQGLGTWFFLCCQYPCTWLFMVDFFKFISIVIPSVTSSTTTLCNVVPPHPLISMFYFFFSYYYLKLFLLISLFVLDACLPTCLLSSLSQCLLFSTYQNASFVRAGTHSCSLFPSISSIWNSTWNIVEDQ